MDFCACIHFLVAYSVNLYALAAYIIWETAQNSLTHIDQPNVTRRDTHVRHNSITHQKYRIERPTSSTLLCHNTPHVFSHSLSAAFHQRIISLLSDLQQKEEMQDRFYDEPIQRLAGFNRDMPRGCQTQLLPEKTRQTYCPFNSPSILQMRIHPKDIAGGLKPHCHRTLFEDDEEEQEQLPVVLQSRSNIQSNAALGKILSQVSRPARPTNEGKQNTQPEEFFSFNNRRHIRYPQTPNFKQLLQSPLASFVSVYQRRIEHLKGQVKRKLPIVSMSSDSSPLSHIDLGYKFFICLAEGFKKLMAGCECRVLYKLAVYLQPYDEVVWEWIVKFEEELGCYETAYKLCRVGLLFTGCDNLAMKYLRLAEKCEKPVQQLRGALAFIKGRLNHKLYLQLARLEWRGGSTDTAFKVILYLFHQAENNLNYSTELARLLEAQKCFGRALEILSSAIDRNVKLYSVYSSYLKLLENYCEQSVVLESIHYVVCKAEENLPMEVQWRLYVEVAQLYHRFDMPLEEKKFLKAALEFAPANVKWKPYLMIIKALNLEPQTVRNSLVVVELNKIRFVRSQPPLLYNFNEWKHYLHYSLFYLFDRKIEALKLLEEAVQRWPYAGRLWAELLFLQRVRPSSGEDILKQWERIVREVPKSGEVWCQGGRILLQRGEQRKALFCFEAAVHLTPQYGDSFIECLRLYTIRGERSRLKELKRKLLYAEPFYGSVWCFLKPHTKSTATQILGIFRDVWRSAKYMIRSDLYRNNIESSESGLTALDSYNRIFTECQATLVEREKIVSAYDQLDSNRN